MSLVQYSRLCCLIRNSLHPFTAKSTVSITKEQEKSLLITLSQVLTEIKRQIGEFDSDSDDGYHGNPSIDISGKSECNTHGSLCHSSASECIFQITNELVFLLAIESRYGQHLAGNVLVAVSEFVIASGSHWQQFVQSLCSYLELIISKMDSGSSIAAIILVLHNILKQLTHEDDLELLEVYLIVLGSCLKNIQWDLFNGGFNDKIGEIMQPISWFEFCGSLVQLFCSVVSQSSLLGAVDDSIDKNPVIQEICIIFPKILTWCFGKQGDCDNYTLIFQYIRHKILVLMIRLSSLINLDCETVVSWLHLIDKYFQDLLFESITHPEYGQDDCLKDSPFLLSVHDVEYTKTSHRHLQRRVIFVYLKCAFSLIIVKERHKNQCLCGVIKSCSKKGFTALYEWLQKHLRADIFMNSEFYNDCCRSFAKSFLQLFMHEDDMLFKVLLQLTCTPLRYDQQITEDQTSQMAEKNTLLLLSDIFDRVHLFHLFLKELHYDYQVLLDYLISKDTGASCAEYLLRCLRIICDKWNSFLGFQFLATVGSESSYKRRKVANDSCIQQKLSSESSKTDQKTCKQPFYDARDCLLLLKKSIERLHQKDLFPYNPQVLLRRLTSFQELCQRP